MFDDEIVLDAPDLERVDIGRLAGFGVDDAAVAVVHDAVAVADERDGLALPVGEALPGCAFIFSQVTARSPSQVCE